MEAEVQNNDERADVLCVGVCRHTNVRLLGKFASIDRGWGVRQSKYIHKQMVHGLAGREVCNDNMKAIVVVPADAQNQC